MKVYLKMFLVTSALFFLIGCSKSVSKVDSSELKKQLLKYNIDILSVADANVSTLEVPSTKVTPEHFVTEQANISDYPVIVIQSDSVEKIAKANKTDYIFEKEKTYILFGYVANNIENIFKKSRAYNANELDKKEIQIYRIYDNDTIKVVNFDKKEDVSLEKIIDIANQLYLIDNANDFNEWYLKYNNL